MSQWSQLGLQDAATPLMEEFIYFHDLTLTILILILSVVTTMMMGAFTSSLYNKNLLEGQKLETAWTFFPAILLLQIGIPSLMLLYLSEDLSPSHIILKVMGFQWYWTYEISTTAAPQDFIMEAYMIPSEDLEMGSPRLLSVDCAVPLPSEVRARILVSSNDVLHSWAIPALGVKADAIPGRLNQIIMSISRPGTYFGQCSEICGANHSFMPITLNVMQTPDFFMTLNSMNGN